MGTVSRNWASGNSVKEQCAQAFSEADARTDAGVFLGEVYLT